MRLARVTRSLVHTAHFLLRRLRVGGVFLVFPALLGRFGEPSAILFAEITCPQAMRAVVMAPNAPLTIVPTPGPLAPPNTLTRVRAKSRPFFSLSLREMWESRARTLSEADRVPAPAPLATRTGDRPSS
ncbi:MAG: hypothetical protein ABI120_08380 [Gemmatimonadaceae bacterium]